MTELPIIFPPGFTPTVKEGESVTKGQVLAEKTLSHTKNINLSELFHIPPHAVKRTLRKNPGDSVAEGDILAVSKSALGVKEHVVRSSGSGIVAGFERGRGTLSILSEESTVGESSQSLISPIDGIVTLCNNEKIVLETSKNVVSATNAVGKSAEGELMSLLSGEQGDSPKSHELTTEIIGKIILGNSFTRETLLKAIGMDVAAVIGFAIEDRDLEHIMSANITTPVLLISDKQKKIIGKWAGKTVFVDAVTKSILLLK